MIEFLVDGQPIRFTGCYYESYRISKGDHLVARYDPKQPATTARVVQPLESWTAWWLFGMGAIAVLFSLRPLIPIRKPSSGNP